MEVRSPTTMTGVRGRGCEIAIADDHLSATRSGEGSVLLLDGPPGIGKTALAGEIAARGDRAGMRVLRAGARGRLGPLPAAVLEAEPRAFRAEPGFWMVHDLGDALAGAAARTPLVFVLDDLHTVDGDTATAIRSLIARLRDRRILWLLAGRRGQAGPAAGELMTHLERADAEVLRLGPLSAEARAILVTDLVPTAGPALRAAADIAGGHPFWTAELVRGLHEEGLTATGPRRLTAEPAHGLHKEGPAAPAPRRMTAEPVRGPGEDGLNAAGPRRMTAEPGRGLREEYPGTAEPRRMTAELFRGVDEEGFEAAVPRRVTVALVERMCALTPAARRAVRVAGALPARFTAAQLAGLLRCGPADLIEPLDEVVRAGLFAVEGGDIRFDPALLRRAARATLPDSLRRALEREAADVLLRTGAAPAEVAALLAGSARPDDRAAIAALRASARAVGDPGAAAGMLVRAFELLPPGDGDRGEVALEALDQLRRAGHAGGARDLAGRVLGGGLLPMAEGAAVRLVLSTLLDRPAAERAAENKAGLALRGVPLAVRARHSAWLAFNLLEDGELGEAERVAVASPDSCDMARLVLAGVHSARGSGALAAAIVDRVLSTADPGDPDAGPRDLLTAVVLHHLGRIGDAEATLAECLRRARAERDAPLLARGVQLSAMMHLTGGRLAEARALAGGHLSEARAQAGGHLPEARAQAEARTPAEPDAGNDLLRMITLSFLAQHLGDAALGRAARKLRTGDSPAGRRWAARVPALTAAGRGDAHEAARLLRDDPLLGVTPPLPVDFAFLVSAGRIAAAAGDEGLRERLLVVSSRAGSAVAAHVQGLLTGDAEQLSAAAKLQAAAGRPLLAAGAREDAAAALPPGDRDEAVRRLEEALAGFADAGAEADVQRVRRSLREHGAGRPAATRTGKGWESLTDAELKVVRLVAAGATNRRAAGELHLSPHTVNTHVRNVFTKLGIRSRVQLAHELRDNS
ncbi:LuxR C-terminal-related transcriptional regulator [Actinoplanes sp. Pm04-4]|uniref:LuxR C-terminal-related transcriptional regulator n=1 Tax=Paractinoplanes pyxinae TaxID=2997416 RepID=A0ABT4AY10_9ACTN|nr:LuxR family transcriptional regulator [Actinoplanes pyxinae]MCY1139129.1 LuxR C-terminal-related transcriptional regulator [Actinoplanes pyxinae]